MKETTVILLCAVALAQAGKITLDKLAQQCDCIEAQEPCKNDDLLLAHKYCDMFYKCSNGKSYAMKCASNLLYDAVNEICEWPHLVACGDRPVSTNSNNGCDCDKASESEDDDENDLGSIVTCNCNPEDAPSICAGLDSDSILVAHEKCNKFYICAHGEPVTVKCPPNTLYNPYKEECDWPSNVECGDRVIPDTDDNVGDNDGNGNENDSNGNDNDNNGTCNCNPEDAPSICAGSDSDSVLVAHEKCNKFYICAHGEPVTVKCPPNTLYNPYKEECDWPSNVECGGRVIPDTDDSVGDNDGNGNENDSNGNDNDNNGTCNCNPEDAPSICAGSDSDSVLVAHEKCNKFYICAHGEPVTVKCPPNTLYNPYKEECDWPSNVECGDRVIPDTDDGVGDNDGNGNENDSNGNDNDNNGTCNCNPEDAPSICAGTDSDSVLVAHEKCNKFYICAHGEPVTVKCPPNTLYNPYKEECDWPSNVECGDRVIPDTDDGVGDNDGNGNENDSNGNDNDNNGTCNCNPEDAPSICGGSDSDSILVAHENCNKFYICAHGEPVTVKCPPNTLYNPYKEECDWPSNVECGDRVIPDTDNGVGDNDGNGNENDSNGNDNDNNGTCNCNPEDAPSICAGSDSDSILVAHEKCNKFYICAHGEPVTVKCPPNTLYNPYKEECDWPSNVECGDRVIPDTDDSVGDNDGNGNENDSNGNDNDNNGTCNCNPEDAPSICAGSDSDSVLVAHEKCNKFYICAHGEPVTVKCPPNTLYNPYKEECDWPSNVECGDRVIPDTDDGVGDNDGNGNENDSNGNDNDNNGTCNCNPEDAPSICAGTDSDSVLVAHEKCNKFYICAHGEPVTVKCPPNTLNNPYKEECDWPSNVECGDRVIPDTDDGVGDNDGNGNENDSNGNDNDNNGTCNCNPEDAPSICGGSDSDSILVAHEKCNKFYICAHGEPVTVKCPPNTLYNPYKEECDWPSNVECGDRVIPDTDNGVGDNDGNGNENDSNGNDNDNNGTCNCNPEDAPSICAGSDSDSILVAHEKCNKFYICAHGEPVTVKCPPNTLYNPYKEECDWPSNVECGDRVIPDTDDSVGDNDGNGNENDSNGNDNDNNGTCNCNPEDAPSICAGSDSDSVLVAHEKCNKFYICAHGEPVTVKCPPNTLYNPYKEECDWPSNVECGDRVIPDTDDGVGDNDGNGNENDSNGNDNDNNGTCNCNPEDAPSICAGSDSDSVLVAHEKCNKFYICAHGEPVTVKCPPNTLYNPYKEECDWPSNVECGDRVIPDTDDSVGDNDGNGNENDSNGSDNDNNGTCNCNPEDAPSICAGSDSDSILVAHEKCNKFYICAHGEPVTVKCPPNTLYNPYKEECDWPSNVECGDRVIPDTDDGVGDNDGNGNENDSNGNDNDNNGTCNCNPEDAPSICAGSDSDSVLVAHEKCNKFYICAHGEPVTVKCPPNTLYNPYKEECDWPSNVECGDRVIPDTDDSVGDNDGNGNENNSNGIDNDNNGTCNCNPEDAPSICAGSDSDSVLVAHEKCNKFYICAHGEPVTVTCPPNTLYNPYKEVCDWPENVQCGDRLIPEQDCDDDNDSVDDNSGNDDDNNDNDGNDNHGTCNCNPEEAPSICASADSDGVLVAHEECNKFYKCAHGQPIEFCCPSNTFYNPYIEVCDWESRVMCGRM